MSRKWLVCVVMLLILPMFQACRPKPPETPDEVLEVETTPVEEPAVEVEPPRQEVVEDVQEDTLPTDLVELNEYLQERQLIGDVFFDLDKSELREEARERLANNAAFMRENPGLVFTIEGHCDERGTNEYNLALGQRRGNTAKDYLTSLQVPADRLQVVSFGEERPFCTESDEACWQRNRRAHFVVTGRR